MSIREYRKLVRQHRGWIEGDIAYFPSVHCKQQFEAAFAHRSRKALGQ